MEVEGQQFHQVVRPVHRAVDPGARPLEHPPLAVAQVEDQELRLAPLDADLAAVLHPLALRRLDLRSDADPPAIDLGDDVLPGHLLAAPGAARHGTAASHGSVSPGPRPPVGGTCGGPPSRRASAPGGGVRRGPTRSRGARRSGGPPGFAGRGWPPCGCPGPPVRDKPRCLRGPGPVRCGTWGRSRSWRSRRPGRPGGGASAAASPGGVAIGRRRGRPLFSGSARSPGAVASARRVAVIWSARWRKWSWISTSRRAKLTGSWASWSRHCRFRASVCWLSFAVMSSREATTGPVLD